MTPAARKYNNSRYNETNDKKERIMKKIMMIIVMVAAMVLPAMAQQQEWKSTSTMPTSGSTYAPQLTEVGATSAAYQATTTESYSPGARHANARRKDGDFNETGDPGVQGDEGSPVGDALLPLLALACVYAVYSATRVYRRKRRA